MSARPGGWGDRGAGPGTEGRGRAGAGCGRLRKLLAGAALAGLSGAGFPLRAGNVNSLPVPTEKSACYDPAVHNDLTGHLLFLYLVDSTGRVSGVRAIYKEVEPPAKEAKLVGHMIQCLEGWKYRPGMREGRTVEMGLMTPFHFFGLPPPDEPQIEIPGGKTIGRSRLDEMRAAKLRLVEHLLSGRQYTEARGPGWELRTDLGAKDVNTVRRSLELAAQTFDAVFPGLPAVGEARPVTVVVFRDAGAHEQVVAFDNLIPDRNASSGLYSSYDRMLYTAKGLKPTEIVGNLLVHEMTHHLVEERLYPGDRWAPRWVHEGIAEFMESLDYRRKEPGDFSALEKSRISGSGGIWKSSAEQRMGTLRDELKKGALPPLEDLLSGGLDSKFNQADSAKYYAVSWLLVHYLINAEGGRYRVPFQAWMTGPQWGGDGETLAAAIGRPLAGIETALPAYLEHLK